MEIEKSPQLKTETDNQSQTETKSSASYFNLTYTEALNFKIWQFLTTPIQHKKEALYKIELKPHGPQLPPSIVNVLLSCFSYPSDVQSLYEYLARIHKPDLFESSPVKELACFFYSQIILKLGPGKPEDVEQEVRLILYAVCFNLAQKYLFDRDVQPSSMARLLGMEKKTLYEREVFVLEHIFDFCLKVDETSFEKFRNCLYSL